MAESYTNITEGPGKKQHSFQRTIGANAVEDNVVIAGEPYLASYVATVAGVANVSVANVNDHLMQLMAGASLNLYVRRVHIAQQVLAGSAPLGAWSLCRLTAAGTGVSALTPRPLDPGDAASGATARYAVTASKGTEGVFLFGESMMLPSTAVAPAGRSDVSFDLLRTKAIRIPAGTSNGIAIKNGAAIASASVVITIWFDEANF